MHNALQFVARGINRIQKQVAPPSGIAAHSVSVCLEGGGNMHSLEHGLLVSLLVMMWGSPRELYCIPHVT